MEVDLGLSHTRAGFVKTMMSMVRMGSTLIARILAPRYRGRFIIGLGTAGASGAMILLSFAQTYPVALLASGLMGLLSRWFRSGGRIGGDRRKLCLHNCRCGRPVAGSAERP